jgi:hypothetical protein
LSGSKEVLIPKAIMAARKAEEPRYVSCLEYFFNDFLVSHSRNINVQFRCVIHIRFNELARTPSNIIYDS